MSEWYDYVAEQRESDLVTIINDEKLKPEETRKFLDNSFREGEIKTIGTDIDKLKAFFEKYFGIDGSVSFTDKGEE
jgi:type I restriction enzyme R subunit